MIRPSDFLSPLRNWMMAPPTPNIEADETKEYVQNRGTEWPYAYSVLRLPSPPILPPSLFQRLATRPHSLGKRVEETSSGIWPTQEKKTKILTPEASQVPVHWGSQSKSLWQRQQWSRSIPSALHATHPTFGWGLTVTRSGQLTIGRRGMVFLE